MAFNPEDKKRSIIPRWRPFSATLRAGELEALAPVAPVADLGSYAEFEVKRREWKQRRTLVFAQQLIGSAIVYKRQDHVDVKDAVDFVRRSRDATVVAKYLAKRASGNLLISASDTDWCALIRRSRAKTRTLPYSPLPWIDLALGYTISGKISQARRAILTAVRHAPNSRFVLRSATRFFVHTKELDFAHDILCRADSVTHDPMLLASEAAVAFAADRHPRFFRTAKTIVNSRNFSEHHLSELLAALGTIELYSGRHRLARKHFNRSLAHPNENVTAQARWASSQGLAIEMSPEILGIQSGFEARAWMSRYSGDWRASVENCNQWLKFQSFDSAPAILGSYVFSVVLRDHMSAIEIIRRGLHANPTDPRLLNNLAFSAACSADFELARSSLRRIKASQSSELSVYKMATTGLLQYRRGYVEQGRQCYSQAAEMARHLGDRELLKRLVVFWAIEEMRSGGSVSDPIPTRALHLTQSESDLVIRLLVKRVSSVGHCSGH
ncbi:MAG: hypothetical protein OXQ29_28340 [Rhodospirillaceae bacterium]|nr:hypothetical protein [Rhodospirillaceae bacterium]